MNWADHAERFELRLLEKPVEGELFQWFRLPRDESGLRRFGFRLAPGGVHLSKTMMLAELTALFSAVSFASADTIQTLVLESNVLGKSTGAARRLALTPLNTLYGILTPTPLAAVLAKLWHRRLEGRPLLALLCALARETAPARLSGRGVPDPGRDGTLRP